ncbi:beta-1,4-glucuronyltransferase 1 [Papilio machaon]|uniref:beta-1,4-glucuronyltransferase 1 n=1 Tax=Papilio machaon TaxID=76193 RepID=UPI001E663830|nr:beta-1,4-glucuronyltransferase 1 [Papilio machaon]
MTKCLRICGSYSYRLTRRHSTILLIIIFILMLTTIFHLYGYKHKQQRRIPSQVGDFEYRPGSFLKNKQPNKNFSYCHFQYGLPKELKWNSLKIHNSPEIGAKGPYRVIYNAIKGTTFANQTKYNTVTYSTHATPEFLYHVVEIARYWEGPISLSVFVPNYDLDITMQIMSQLCHCYPGMAKVSLHLFYHQNHPPIMRSQREILASLTTETPTTTANITTEQILRNKLDNYRKLNNKTRAQYIQWVRKNKIARMMKRMSLKKNTAPNLKFDDCSGPDYDIPTFRKENRIIYPINVGRNSARNASMSNYFLVSDIEMVPSDGLAQKFLKMVRKLMGDKKRDEGCIFAKTIFVVPLFEVEKGEMIPRDKQSLVRLVTANRAFYFHQRVCSHCQRFPGLQSWLLRRSPSGVEPMLIARREYPYHRWEPLYFGTQREPWYSETLSWEGRQDKMTQMLELCLQEYRMVVLDGGFLSHAAVMKTMVHHSNAERLNNQKYLNIIGKLKQKYPDRPQCRVMWGC